MTFAEMPFFQAEIMVNGHIPMKYINRSRSCGDPTCQQNIVNSERDLEEVTLLGIIDIRKKT